MKKIVLGVVIVSLFLGNAVTTLAVDGANATASTTRGEKLQQKIKEVKQEVRDEARERIASTTARIIDNRYDKMTKRYEDTVAREKAITAKIISRIDKIKTNGGNTTEAEKFVNDAKTKLASAKSAYESMKTLVINTSNASTTKETLTSLKSSTQTINKLLRDAHQLLQKTVGSLRGVSQLRNASSTKEN